jgi:hypothetical protein
MLGRESLAPVKTNMRMIWGALLVAVTLGVGSLNGAGEPGRARTLGPYSLAANFSADLSGQQDNRPNTWGTVEAVYPKIVFHPPDGYRVHILRVYGDFLIWPRGKVEKGRFAGALWALHTTEPDGSSRAEPAADNHLLYVQLATGGKSERAAVDFVVREAGLLGADHTLVVKLAVWLNDTGLAIHMEASFVLVYEFVRSER